MLFSCGPGFIPIPTGSLPQRWSVDVISMTGGGGLFERLIIPSNSRPEWRLGFTYSFDRIP